MAVDYLDNICYNNKACEFRKVLKYTHAAGEANGAVPKAKAKAKRNGFVRRSCVVEKPKEDMKNVSYHNQAAA